jgi:glycerol-3-phosphate acyltransferase PlsX
MKRREADTMRIALDAMGGDLAPASTVEGALMAAKEWTDAEIVLVGDEAKLTPLLKERPPNVSIRHAPDVIEADDEPVRAVRRKKEASMVVCARMVREGEADAMISAGNTGALMACGLLVVGRIPGVDRPALGQMFPTLDGRGVLVLDLGANMDAEPRHLVHYAVMAGIYLSRVRGLANPRIGLLNVGTEEGKGNALSKAAYPLLREAPVRFVGNVEARDVLFGVCDALVTDGFAGNILLKAIEGTAGMLLKEIKREFTASLPRKLAAAVLAPGLKGLRAKLDYREYNGAPLFGLDGIVVKGHGSSDAKGICNAILQARKAVACDLAGTIAAEMKGLEMRE